MIRVVAANSPIDAAWAAFDAAAIRLNRMYSYASSEFASEEERAERMRLSQEVVRLWDEWRALYLGTEPRPAA